MSFTPDQHREYRKRQAEKGLCTECKKPALLGFKMCAEHKEVLRQRTEAARRVMRRQDNSFCWDCLNPNDTKHRLCTKCKALARKRHQKFYAAHVGDPTTCNYCWHKLTEFDIALGRKLCGRCITKESNRKARERYEHTVQIQAVS